MKVHEINTCTRCSGVGSVLMLCKFCSGSGEGMVDGSKCYECDSGRSWVFCPLCEGLGIRVDALNDDEEEEV